jgi:fatty-acyl-CoA synthase
MTQVMGLMQDDFPLNLHHIRRRMRSCHPGAEVVTLNQAGAVERATFGEVSERVDRLARVLRRLGVETGDRVGTFARNNQRHFELYMAIPCVGAVLHTLNVRLFEEQLTYIVNHADDKAIFVDDSLVPLLEKLAPSFENVAHYVVMGATRSCWRMQDRGRSTIPRWTSARRRRCVTPAAPPVTRRACCTRIARSACIRAPP